MSTASYAVITARGTPSLSSANTPQPRDLKDESVELMKNPNSALSSKLLSAKTLF